MPSLDPRILAAWAASASLHRPAPPAVPDDVAAVERALGRRLPPVLVELYRRHDGGDWFSGDLQLMPLRGTELSVEHGSATYRGWDWPVPDDLVLFGSDGGGGPVGVWLPHDGGRPVVVMLGSIFEPACMGIVGEDVNAFLLARTGYCLQLPGDQDAALDALGLPHDLRSDDPDDETLELVRAWADAGVPTSLADPYTALMTADDVRRFASAV